MKNIKEWLDEPVLQELRDRRAGHRWLPQITLHVCGYSAAGLPFCEQSAVLEASPQGGLLRLNQPVIAGKMLLLVNTCTLEEQECRVIYVNTSDRQVFTVGVAFPSVNPGFWSSSKTKPNTSKA